ncbi:MAG: AI-2E family transporter [Rhodospirillaceae bacterium]|nr:AI-2E family transporter [Rhodospirillaceae bacterium]
MALPLSTAAPGRTVRTAALVGLLILASFGAVYLASDILIPIAFAIVLQLLLSPLVRLLARAGIPETLSAGLLLVVVLAGLALAVYLLAAPAAEWLDRMPEITRQLERKLAFLRKPLQDMSRASSQVEAITSVGPTTPQVAVGQPGLMQAVAGNVGAIAAVLGITFILAFFLLASGDLFKQKLVHVMPRLQDKKRALQIVREIEQLVTRYLVTITLVNVAVGVIVGGGMLALGLPNPLLWAAMAVFLSFIPVIGAWIGIAAIFIVAVLTFDDLLHAALAPAIYGLVHMVAENFVTPAVLGRRLTLNPVIIVLNVIVWVWLWGVPGALLAGPFLVTARVLCDHFPSLGPAGEFLSGRQDSSKAPQGA